MTLPSFLRRVPRGGAVSALGLALLSLNACTPQSQYRYTGYVPAARALAWDGRTAKDGTLRLEGTMSSTTVHRNLTPQLHDTALRVPNTTLEGAAFLAPASMIEVGARYAYAAYDWSEPSALGTLGLPSKPAMWGVGLEVRGTLPLDKRKQWAIGVGGNLMRYETPYAEWELAKGGCGGLSPVCSLDPNTYVSGQPAGAYYTLKSERSESHVTMNIAVYPSLQLGKDGELGHVFAGFSVHTTFKNDGFTDTAQNGSTIKEAGLIYIAGIGYSISFEPMRLAAMMALPLTSATSSINYGPAGFLTVGLDLSLWESREDRRRRRLMEEEQRRVPPQAPAPSPPPPPPNAPPPQPPGERSM